MYIKIVGTLVCRDMFFFYFKVRQFYSQPPSLHAYVRRAGVVLVCFAVQVSDTGLACSRTRAVQPRYTESTLIRLLYYSNDSPPEVTNQTVERLTSMISYPSVLQQNLRRLIYVDLSSFTYTYTIALYNMLLLTIRFTIILFFKIQTRKVYEVVDLMITTEKFRVQAMV